MLNDGIIHKEMASFFNIKVKKFMHPFYILNYLGQIFAKISTIKKKQ
jgi:hypothetical protein